MPKEREEEKKKKRRSKEEVTHDGNAVQVSRTTFLVAFEGGRARETRLTLAFLFCWKGKEEGAPTPASLRCAVGRKNSESKIRVPLSRRQRGGVCRAREGELAGRSIRFGGVLATPQTAEGM